MFGNSVHRWFRHFLHVLGMTALVVPVTGKSNIVPVHTTKAYRGSRYIALCILTLGTRWRWLVNFTPQPLYPQGRMQVPIE